MDRFCTLYSGSSGNATFIGSADSGILVDIGKNAKQTTLALSDIGVDPGSIQAIFITHEHSDHVAGLRVFANRYHIPVYASLGTLEALDDKGHLKGDFPVYQITEYANVGDMQVRCFHTSHDCAEGLGYTVELSNGTKVAVATDLGVMTDEVLQSIRGAHTILLESNHDLGMLMNGPYPYSLKERIRSERGHLCNDDAADTAVELLHSGTRQILLGHLSQENNLPALAFETTASRLKLEGAAVGDDLFLKVASRYRAVDLEVGTC